MKGHCLQNKIYCWRDLLCFEIKFLKSLSLKKEKSTQNTRLNYGYSSQREIWKLAKNTHQEMGKYISVICQILRDVSPLCRKRHSACEFKKFTTVCTCYRTYVEVRGQLWSEFSPSILTWVPGNLTPLNPEHSTC